MATNRLYDFLNDMQGPKYRGRKYNAPIPALAAINLMPYGHVHELCGGWIWYTTYLQDDREVVYSVPGNCSCCRVPLDGPRLAVTIQQCLNFDAYLNLSPSEVPPLELGKPFADTDIQEMQNAFDDAMRNLDTLLNEPLFKPWQGWEMLDADHDDPDEGDESHG